MGWGVLLKLSAGDVGTDQNFYLNTHDWTTPNFLLEWEGLAKLFWLEVVGLIQFSAGKNILSASAGVKDKHFCRTEQTFYWRGGISHTFCWSKRHSNLNKRDWSDVLLEGAGLVNLTANTNGIGQTFCWSERDWSKLFARGWDWSKFLLEGTGLIRLFLFILIVLECNDFVVSYILNISRNW